MALNLVYMLKQYEIMEEKITTEAEITLQKYAHALKLQSGMHWHTTNC